MRFFRLFVPACFVLLFALSCLAQNQPAQCLVTCEPDATSGSYGATYGVRPQSKNVRSNLSVFGAVAVNESSEAKSLAGSESYSYAIPIVSLPGYVSGYLPQSTMLWVQIYELGNALALITGRETYEQGLATDMTSASPGQKLVDCVFGPQQ